MQLQKKNVRLVSMFWQVLTFGFHWKTIRLGMLVTEERNIFHTVIRLSTFNKAFTL